MEKDKKCPLCGKELKWTRAADVEFGDFSSDVEVEYCPDQNVCCYKNVLLS